ncbi:MAG: ATP-dependent helicase [Peptostreptococcaceae bacterium]
MLNENQLKAVKHTKGPCMVLAGPGSGKTRVITHRISNMIINENIDPKNILAISFTKASSVEMKNRAIKICNDSRINNVTFATFHSTFFKVLRTFKNYTLDSLIDEKTKWREIKKVLKSLNVENGEEDETVKQVLSEISYVKNELMDIKDFNSEVLEWSNFQKVFSMYEELKQTLNKIDFDDMLVNAYYLLRDNEIYLNRVRNAYKYILIDEFQDINKVQFETIKLIANPNNNIFVVGDEDQSIYGFRGSKPDFLLNFEELFPNSTKILLDINYRSKSEIIDMSNKLIVKNKNRYEKIIKCSRENGAVVEYLNPIDNEDEAKIVAEKILNNVEKGNYKYTDFSVIYRTNTQARALVDIFLDLRIPFVMKDSIVSIYDHWVCVDILSYLRLSLDEKSNIDFLRVINRPFRYISRETLNNLKDSEDIFKSLIEDEDLHIKQITTIKDLRLDLRYLKGLAPSHAISYIRTTLEYDKYILKYCEDRKIKATSLIELLDEIESSASNFKETKEYLDHINIVKEELSSRNSKKMTDGVIFTTMHSSKGLEFKNVFVIGCNEGTIPHEKSYDIEDEDIKKIQIEEERRLMYVAITRAEDNVYISTPKNKHGKKAFTSRFINEIKEPTKKDIDSITVGDRVYHKKFSEGDVVENNDGTLMVKFKDKIRELNLKICLLKDIIKKI